MKTSIPVIGICGYSGSGKTTVIEKLIPVLRRRGLRVAVIKHDAHKLKIDTPGKDSYRFFEAGADVFVHDSNQFNLRVHLTENKSLLSIVGLLEKYYDLILVEGHKNTILDDKIWLLNKYESAPPPDVEGISVILARDADRVGAILEIIEKSRAEAAQWPPVWAGILAGGRSSRMGQPKQLLRLNNKSWLRLIQEATAPYVSETVILGQCELPRDVAADTVVIPDIPDKKGPLAGILAAMRWNPAVSWLIYSCDLPMISGKAIKWILEQRTGQCRAVIPTVGKPQPLLAWYHPAVAENLECVNAPREIINCPHVRSPAPPPRLASAWTNINTPLELKKLSEGSIPR